MMTFDWKFETQGQMTKNPLQDGKNENLYSLFLFVSFYCTATCLLSRKLFKLDEPDMQDTAGEAGTNS